MWSTKSLAARGEQRHKDTDSSGWGRNRMREGKKKRASASNHSAESRKGLGEVVTGDCHV